MHPKWVAKHIASTKLGIVVQYMGPYQIHGTQSTLKVEGTKSVEPENIIPSVTFASNTKHA